MQGLILTILMLGGAISVAMPFAGANLLRVWPVMPIYVAGVIVWLVLVGLYVARRRRRGTGGSAPAA